MKKNLSLQCIYILNNSNIIAMFILFILLTNKSFAQRDSILSNNTFLSRQIPENLKSLCNSYPNYISVLDYNHIVWKDGEIQVFDDSLFKTFDQMLDDADLQEQMNQDYVIGRNYVIPILNYDPGRIRNEYFFKKMYGKNEVEVKKNLVSIVWLPKSLNQKLLVTKINGVDKKLEKISNILDTMVQFLPYLQSPGGTYVWRKIKNTNRLSMHSFGIAIDINIKFSDYWLWNLSKDKGIIKYKNRIPMEIVEIFEKEGFIWGGKWYHYDTMHFEYRPELILK